MRRIVLAIAAMFVGGVASAQVQFGGGQISGSLESTSIYYMNDKKLGETPEDRFGSNNYLKLDYASGRFSAGVQINAFLPVLQGYEDLATGHKFYLASKYVQWQDKNFELYVGDIFDQLGNGLVFRSFEDRQLGLNNSLEGIRGVYNFGQYVSVKGLYGRPRLYTDYADAWVRAADVSLSVADMVNWESGLLSLEGSYVNRNQSLTLDPMLDLNSMGLSNPNLNMYSGRVNLGWNGLSLRGEYVAKGKDLAAAATKAVKGNAMLAELGYNYKNFTFMGTFRQLDNMETRLSLYDTGVGNTLNYLPALTRQYTYMLANLNPYQVNAQGEIGGQADVCYSLRNEDDRYRYWNFHVNYSLFYTLNKAQSHTGNRERLWQDFNFDVERQWNKQLKTIFLYSFQEWNPTHGMKHRTYVSNVFVGDVTYKFDRKKSLRVEAQYLWSNEYEGDWVAGLVEFSLAPQWSFFLSDMYNIDDTKHNEGKSKNYFNGGFSYTHDRTRVQLSYGRNRAGYVCSGGVCRYSPAYTGFNLVLTSSF